MYGQCISVQWCVCVCVFKLDVLVVTIFLDSYDDTSGHVAATEGDGCVDGRKRLWGRIMAAKPAIMQQH